MAREFLGRTPDGEVTADLDYYARSWRTLGDRVAEKLDAHLMGMDPNIRLCPKGAGGPVLDLPVWAANKILSL
jgi:hypothetical protein